MNRSWKNQCHRLVRPDGTRRRNTMLKWETRPLLSDGFHCIPGMAKYKPKPQVERLVKKINCQIKLLLPCVCPVTDWVSTGSFMKLSAIVHTGEQKLGIALPAWVRLAQFQSRIICEGDLWRNFVPIWYFVCLSAQFAAVVSYPAQSTTGHAYILICRQPRATFLPVVSGVHRFQNCLFPSHINRFRQSRRWSMVQSMVLFEWHDTRPG